MLHEHEALRMLTRRSACEPLEGLMLVEPAVPGGAREDRTPDLLRARQALSQLSYGPGQKHKASNRDSCISLTRLL